MIEVKTNWAVKYDSNGNYMGDFFNYQDYNRIANNYTAILNYGKYFYPIPISTFKPLSGYDDYLNSDHVNDIEKTAQNIYDYGYKISQFTGTKIWYDNQLIFTNNDLNRLENYSQIWYNLFSESYQGLPRLSLKLGRKGNF